MKNKIVIALLLFIALGGVGNSYYNNVHNKIVRLEAALAKVENNTQLKIALPPTIYAVVGKEINIYFDNIIDGKADQYQIDVASSIGVQQEERWTSIPDTAGTFPLTITIYRDHEVVSQASSEIIVKNAEVGSGANRKVLIIGDSNTDYGVYTGELLNLFNSDPMDITLMGTRGTAPNLTEGREGWSTLLYESNTYPNPFYNNGGFDFSYYMAQQDYPVPDHVMIMLGTNDVFDFTDDIALLPFITDVLNRIESMVASIKDFNPNIKVGLMITIPAATTSQDAFGHEYGSGRTYWRYKHNNFLLVREMITRFRGRESKGVYLVPTNVNLDTINNVQVEEVPVNSRNSKIITRQRNGLHPAPEGNYQIADSVYYYLKNFEF